MGGTVLNYGSKELYLEAYKAGWEKGWKAGWEKGLKEWRIDLVTRKYQRGATGVLNEIMAEAVALQQPPTDKGKRLRLYYITQVSVKPPTFVIFVNDKELMHFSYTRYIENKIREAFGFRGTPLKFIIRERKENNE